MILRVFDLISKLVWYAVVALSILLALYVSLGRYYVPLIGDYRPQIVAQLSEMSGLNFEIDDLRGEWSGFSPAVHIDSFSILGISGADGSQESLTIPELKVSLDVISSVRHQSLHLKSLKLNAAELSFQQSEDGHWRVEGLPLGDTSEKAAEHDSSGKSTSNTLLDLLLDISTLEISNTRLKFSFADGRNAELTALDIKLINDGGFRRLVISSKTGEEKVALLAVLEGYGDPRNAEQFEAKAYGKLDDFNLAAFAHLAKLNFDLHRLSLNGEFWLDWQNTALSVQGKLSSPEIDFRRKDGKSIWHSTDFSGEFLVEKNRQDRWQAWIPGLQTAQQVTVKPTHIRTEKLPEGEVLQLQSEGLALAPLVTTLLAGDLLNEQLRETLTTLSPAGNLQNVSLILPLAGTSKDMFQLRADLVNVSVNAWKGAPGAKTVNGFLQAGILQGFVDLDTKTLSLDFPHIYDHWLEFDGAEATVAWHIDEQSIIIESELIKLKSKGKDGFASGQFFLDLPRKADEYPPHMTLNIGLRDSDARYRQRYIPRLLSADLLQWLEQSIGEGQLPEVGFIYHGPIKKTKDQPSVQLFAEVKKASLDYHKDWPAINNADALVMVDNQYTDIQLAQARLYNSDIKDVQIHLEPHTAGGLQLDVSGRVIGELGDGLRVIKESPVRESLGDFINGWQAQGYMSAKLDLSIPLGKDLKREAKVLVDVDLQSGALSLSEEKLDFKNINGPVVYDSKRGISSKGLQLTLWEKPARLSIVSKTKASKTTTSRRWRTELSMQGRADMEALRKWVRQPALDFFDGETAFDAHLFIDPDQENYLSVTSDLKGITIELPEPYHKEAASIVKTTYRLPLEGDKRLMTLQLSDQLQVQLLNDKDFLLGGHISIGSEEISDEETARKKISAKESGIEALGVMMVTGNFSTFHFSQWLPVFNRYMQVQESLQQSLPQYEKNLQQQEGSGQSLADSSDAVKHPSLPLVVRAVTADTFEIFDREVKDLRVDINYQPGYWRVHLDSDTLLGDVDVFDDERPFRISLDYLHLDDLLKLDESPLVSEDALGEALFDEIPEGEIQPSGAEDQLQPKAAQETSLRNVVETAIQTKAEKKRFHPKDIAEADFSIAKLYRQQEDYGTWAFELRSLPDGLRIEKLLASSKSLNIAGVKDQNGALIEWRQLNGGDNSSRFRGLLSAKNIGDVLEDWGYEKMMVSESAVFNIDSVWQGDPSEISVQAMTGKIHMKINNGDFINAPSSASSALKVVGFLNLDKIVRRMQLDFSDLAAEGLSFDRISGDLKVADGILVTDKELNVLGSSSEIRIAGRVDFTAETVNGEMVVILPLGSNLPWIAAALAGGLPAAASVYVASKLLKKQVDVLSSAVYSINGGWDDPEIKFEKLFDSTPEVGKASAAKDKEPEEVKEAGLNQEDEKEMSKLIEGSHH